MKLSVFEEDLQSPSVILSYKNTPLPISEWYKINMYVLTCNPEYFDTERRCE